MLLMEHSARMIGSADRAASTNGISCRSRSSVGGCWDEDNVPIAATSKTRLDSAEGGRGPDIIRK